MSGIIIDHLSIQTDSQIKYSFFYDFTSTPLIIEKNDINIRLISTTFFQNINDNHGGSIRIVGQNINITFENVGATHCKVYCYDENSFHEGNFAYIILGNGPPCEFNRMTISLCSENRDYLRTRGSFHCVTPEGIIENTNISNCFAERHSSLFLSQGTHESKNLRIQNTICSNNYFIFAGLCIHFGNCDIDNLFVDNSVGEKYVYLNSEKSIFRNSIFYDNEDVFHIEGQGIHSFNNCYLENFSFRTSESVTIDSELPSKGSPIYVVNHIMKIPKEALQKRCSQKYRNWHMMMFITASSSSLYLL